MIIIFSAVLFVVSALLAARHTMSAVETSVFNFIYGWNIDAKPIFWLITQLGSAWVAVSGIVIFWWYKKRRLALKLFL